MVKLRKFKRELIRELLIPSKEILQVINDKKRVRSTQLRELVNRRRTQIAKLIKMEVPNMSPTTVYSHLEELMQDGAVRKIVVSHKEVYYAPGPRFDEAWIYSYIVEGIAILLNSLDRNLGLIEAIRLFDKIRKRPDRIEELENSVRMLCRVFEKEIPEPIDNDFIVIQVQRKEET